MQFSMTLASGVPPPDDEDDELPSVAALPSSPGAAGPPEDELLQPDAATRPAKPTRDATKRMLFVCIGKPSSSEN
jgi:hypothetical protein